MADKVKQESNTAPRGIAALPKLHGLYTRVAKRANVSRQFVHQVATGARRSKRIERALSREYSRLRRLLVKQEEEAA